MRKKKVIFLIILFFPFSFGLLSQDIPLHISHKSVYSFLDELASLKVIDINPSLRPYGRMYILEKLLEAEKQSEKLNKTQRKELKFHLLEFNLERDAEKKDYKANLLPKRDSINLCFYPLGLFYNNKWFELSIKPIWGVEYYLTSFKKGQNPYRYWGGGEMMGYIGKHVAFYVAATDNSQSQPMSTSEKLTQIEGAVLKGQADVGNTDYFNVRGGMSFTWKWGTVSVIKDNIVWGSNYNGSNIFSGRTLPYAMIKLRISPVPWFEYNYFHGWLASNLVDSNATYTNASGGNRYVMINKMLAANMITFRPIKGLYLNIGNSVVYSDMDFQLQYLIPFMVYKAVDDNYNATQNSAGQNTQLFVDLSCRNLKYFHFYTGLFIDELSFRRMFDKSRHSNYISWKAGVCYSGLPRTFSATFEYTRTNPNVYQHPITATNFTSNSTNLGHYLGSNAEEFFAQIAYRPVERLSLKASYTFMRKGTDYRYQSGNEPWGLPFMEKVIFYNHIAALKVEWEFINNCFVYGHFYYYRTGGEDGMVEKYNPPYFQNTSGLPVTIMTGFNIGF